MVHSRRPPKYKPTVGHSGKSYVPSVPLKRSHHGRIWELLDRSQLDGRTLTARLFDRTVNEITTDLGGDLTGIEKALADSFAVTCVLANDLSTRVLLGQEIDMAAWTQVARTQVLLATKLGISRKPKDVSVTLDDYLSTGRKRRRPPRQINGEIEYEADVD